MTRLWPQGTPITVAGDAEAPVSFAWQAQDHGIKEITRRWRINLDWWNEQVWRDYFKLTTRTGLLVVIYHELPSGEWYLQRLYD